VQTVFCFSFFIYNRIYFLYFCRYRSCFSITSKHLGF